MVINNVMFSSKNRTNDFCLLEYKEDLTHFDFSKVCFLFEAHQIN